jgi:predicted RNA-binding Zn-ribbon protein involved in translation (DUF1610 family)
MICADVRPAESWGMTARPEKITFAQMRNSGVRGILVYCSDYACSHSIALHARSSCLPCIRIGTKAIYRCPGTRNSQRTLLFATVVLRSRRFTSRSRARDMKFTEAGLNFS